MKKDSPGWNRSIRDKKFYLVDKANDIYASLKITVYAYNDGKALFRVEAVANPNGSRNLEGNTPY